MSVIITSKDGSVTVKVDEGSNVRNVRVNGHRIDVGERVTDRLLSGLWSLRGAFLLTATVIAAAALLRLILLSYYRGGNP